MGEADPDQNVFLDKDDPEAVVKGDSTSRGRCQEGWILYNNQMSVNEAGFQILGKSKSALNSIDKVINRHFARKHLFEHWADGV